MTNDAPDQEQAGTGDYVCRIETELLRTRKVLIFGDINDRLARDV
jgi:ATP-dependent Clp protease, protease subunit